MTVVGRCKGIDRAEIGWDMEGAKENVSLVLHQRS